MTARLLEEKLLPKLIEIIKTYQIPIKDSAFIVRWMKTLVKTYTKQSYQTFWKFLVRDSVDLVIQLPQHQLSSFNFAYFVQDFIKNNQNRQYCKYFETFCTNAIRNNPSLIFNRYYVGNGGSPCYQLISTFLFVDRINGSIVSACQQIQDAIFNIYAFIMQQDYLSTQECYRFFYGFNYGIFCATKYAVNVLKIFFEKYQVFFLEFDPEGIEVTYYNNTKQMISGFFKIILKQLDNKKNLQQQIRCMRLHYQRNQEEDYNMKQLELRKQKIQQFLYYFQERHFAILDKYKKEIVQQTFPQIELKPLHYLIMLPGFRSLIFSQGYVFHLIKTRKFKLFQLLWSFQEDRDIISKFRLDNKNILEVVAENRGLTHNFIDILWNSKLFQTLPQIKNQKSKSIIHLRYGIPLQQNS